MIKRLATSVVASALLTVSIAHAQVTSIANGGAGATTAAAALSSVGGLPLGGGTVNGPISILSAGVSTQSPLNQLLPVTSLYTSAMLNSNNDILRVQVGNCGASREFARQPAGTTNYTTTAILGCVVIPAGSSRSQPSWPDPGVSGIGVTYNAGKSAVGVFGMGGMGVSGSSTSSLVLAEGANVVVSNTPNGSLAKDGQGRTNFVVNGYESDIDVFAMAGGGAPFGNIQGVTSYIGGTVQPSSESELDAFAAVSANTPGPSNGLPTPHWINAYASHNGMAINALYVGAVSGLPNSPSQSIALNSINPSGSQLLAGIQSGVDGSVNFNYGKGSNPQINMQGQSVLKVAAGLNELLDPAGNAAVTTANGVIYFSENNIVSRSKDQSMIFTNMNARGVQLVAFPAAPQSGSKGGNVCYDTNGYLYKC